jgi:5'-nucleotidase
MRLLLSNDDGVFAQGLQALFEGLHADHDITVIAPDRNCSGASNALSLRTPLRIEKMHNDFYAVNGDCSVAGKL